MKIGIYDGNIPSSSFIELLIQGLAKKNIVWVYGNKKSKWSYSNKNIKILAFKNGFISKLIYVSYKIFLFLFFHPKQLKLILNSTNSKNIKQKINQLRKTILFVESPPDIIHVQWIKGVEDILPLKKIHGVRLLISLRGYQVSVEPFLNDDLAKRYLHFFDIADKIHSISDDLTAQAITLGAKAEKIVKIPPAIDLIKFPYRGNKKLSYQPVKLITVGRFHWKKGYTYLIDALKLLKEADIQFEITFIGEGEEEQNLKFQVFQLGLQNEVFFLGKKPHSEILFHLSSHDIYLQTSVQEGFCNSVLEAQAVGLLCVVSDAEGLPENVDNGECGWIVPKRNSKAIFDTIMSILNLPQEKYYEIQRKASQRVYQQFGIDKQIQAFENLYKEIYYKN